MKRFVLFALVLAVALSVTAGSVLAGEPTQTRSMTQTKAQAGDCVCDGPNCDADCPQYSYQNQTQNQTGSANQGEASGPFEYLVKLMLKFFGGK